MSIVLYVRMGSVGTFVKIIDRGTGEILDEWFVKVTDANDLPLIVMDGVAFYREKYRPERVYFDVEREVTTHE